MSERPGNVLNAISRISQHQCAAPAYVYVETFLPAFLYMVIWLALFGIEDIIISGSRKTVQVIEQVGTGRRGKHIRGTRRRGGIGVRPKYRFGSRFFFRIISAVEFLGFTFQLITAVDFFTIAWTSLVERSVFCQDGAVPGPLQKTNSFAGFLAQTDWQPMDYGVVEQNRSNWLTTTTRAQLPPGRYFAVAAMKATPSGEGTVELTARLRATTASGTKTVDEQTTTLTGGQSGDIILAAGFGSVLAPEVLIFWEMKWSNGGFINEVESDLVIEAVTGSGIGN